MITKELLDYIRKQIAEGITAEALTGSLREAGWAEDDITGALRAAGVRTRATVPVSPLPVAEPDLWPDAPRRTAASVPALPDTSISDDTSASDDMPVVSPVFPKDANDVVPVGERESDAVSSTQENSGEVAADPPSHPFFAESSGNAGAKSDIPSAWADHPRGPAGAAGVGAQPAKSGGRILALFLGVGLIVAAGAAGGYWYYLRQLPEPDPIADIKASFAKLRTYSALAYSGTLKIRAGKASELDARIQKNPTAAVISAFLGLAQMLPASTTIPLRDDFIRRDVVPMEELEFGTSSPVFIPSIQSGSLTLGFDAAFDRSDTSSPKGFANWTLDADFPSYGSMSLAAEARLIEKVVYARITKVPFIGFELGAMKEQWIRIDLDPAKLQKELGSDASLPPGFMEKAPTSLTETEMQHLMDALKDVEFFTNVRVSPPENADGVSVARYDFAVDKNAVGKFLESVTAILNERGASSGEQDPEKMRQAIDTAFQYIASIDGAVWIGTEDGLPHRVEFRLVVQPPADEKASVDKSEDAGQAARFALDVRFKDFGKPLSLAPPGDSRPLKDVFSVLFETPQKRSRDARRISDIKQIQLGAELYFDEKGAYPSDLTQLVTDGFMAAIPKDPRSEVSYSYCTDTSHKKYHLGAVLEEGDSAALKIDADFDSGKAGWTCGFSGQDEGPCGEPRVESDPSDRCYDVIP
ncbi:MAG: hypothetical protein AAB539_02205 [Patescibacteria group bacterium]